MKTIKIPILGSMNDPKIGEKIKAFQMTENICSRCEKKFTGILPRYGDEPVKSCETCFKALLEDSS